MDTAIGRRRQRQHQNNGGKPEHVPPTGGAAHERAAPGAGVKVEGRAGKHAPMITRRCGFQKENVTWLWQMTILFIYTVKCNLFQEVF